eukprot:TRINITY_DN7814_c0_g4_i1.p1 TRINITY_DN7814_c0_g4~~TRINITY_DN7814_c0_g4_i1.p1  ORF type:complete len:472 (+),score=104.43 TRINITY_DN7814_c0_g4_i1:78-1493(+)
MREVIHSGSQSPRLCESDLSVRLRRHVDAADEETEPLLSPTVRAQSRAELLRTVSDLVAINESLSRRLQISQTENEYLLQANQRLLSKLRSLSELRVLQRLPGDLFAHIFTWLNIRGLRACLRTCRSWRRTVIESKAVGPRLRQKILVIGGSDGARRHDNVEQYDLLTGRWSTLLGPGQDYLPAASDYQLRDPLQMKLRQAKGAMAAVHSGDCVYVMGGFHDLPLRDTEVYNLRTRTWRDLPPMGTARSKAATAQAGSCVYIMGGYNGNAPLRSVEKFDMKTEAWSHSPAMRELRGAPAAAELGGCIYVFGGWKGNIMNGPHTALNTAEKFNPADGTWTPIAPMRYARSTPSAVVLYGHIYVLGGYNGDETSNQGVSEARLTSVERYDPKSNTWTEVSSMRCGRSGEAAVAVDGRIFVVGGWDGQEHFNLVEVYSPVTDRWVLSANLRLKRRDPAAITLIAPPYTPDEGLD